MSITNDFLQFATGGGANVESQADYLADSNRVNGNQTGIALSAFNNKALRQANFITSQLAQLVGNYTNTNVLDNTIGAQFLSQLSAVVTPLPIIISTFTSSTGTYSLPYTFFVATANATSGATYTNNAITYTVSSTISGGLTLVAGGSAAPNSSGTLTKTGGTGDATITFYAFRMPLYLRIRMVGGGGGGGGCSGSTSTAGNGGDTTFGTSFLTGGGGLGGVNGNAGGGGTTTVGSGPVAYIRTNGTNGYNGGLGSASVVLWGGLGGQSPFGGWGSYSADAYANTGSGGGGGTTTSTVFPAGGGGGSGGYLEAYVVNPTGTYGTSIGAGGAGGPHATGGLSGTAGGSGIIIVEAHFQ